MKDTKYWRPIKRDGGDGVILCNYCLNRAEFVDNKEIYGKSYSSWPMTWLCRPCDAYVGCHKNTREPLGSLAKRPLREKRVEAKNLFIKNVVVDWNDKSKKAKAYRWLRGTFGLNHHTAHFGLFTEEMCQRIIDHFTSNI